MQRPYHRLGHPASPQLSQQLLRLLPRLQALVYCYQAPATHSLSPPDGIPTRTYLTASLVSQRSQAPPCRRPPPTSILTLMLPGQALLKAPRRHGMRLTHHTLHNTPIRPFPLGTALGQLKRPSTLTSTHAPLRLRLPTPLRQLMTTRRLPGSCRRSWMQGRPGLGDPCIVKGIPAPLPHLSSPLAMPQARGRLQGGRPCSRRPHGSQWGYPLKGEVHLVQEPACARGASSQWVCGAI